MYVFSSFKDIHVVVVVAVVITRLLDSGGKIKVYVCGQAYIPCDSQFG